MKSWCEAGCKRGYKTRRLVQENAMQEGLGRLTKSVTFDLKTLEALRGKKGGNEGKVFNLVRGLQKELDDNPNAAPILQPLKDRAERIKTTGLAAMDLLAALATEREAAAKAAKETGLSSKAFAVFWLLRNEAALKSAGVDPMEIARETEVLLARFPNASVNADEQRRLRAALYRPLLALKDERTRIVDLIVASVTS
jgi:type I restriction enzyme, R subunit